MQRRLPQSIRTVFKPDNLHGTSGRAGNSSRL
jgi:hypothetical protein